MAEKKSKKGKESKIVLERTYNIPLRREWLKVAKYRRAKKAVKAVKQFLIKHMKSEEVKVGKYINLEIWKHGIKNPPHHVKVNVTKDDKGLVKSELVGAPVEKVPEKKKKKPETTAEKVKDMMEKKEKPEEKKEETKAEEKKEAPKTEEKVEISEKEPIKKRRENES